MLVLGIETSCDETSAAVVRGPHEGGVDLLSNVVASQDDLHAHFGGIVPEVASRRHVEMITPVVAEALQRSKISWSDLDAIAVAVGPGLIGSLVVGVAAAQAFAVARDLPLIGVHHLEGHIYSATIGGALPLPAVILIASGGHSHLVLMRGHGQYEILGRTRDDAPGEAFDKGARLLGLPYPGGPQLAALADSHGGRVEPLPRAQMPGSRDFSFSGVKTALARIVREEKLTEARRTELAAAYQESIALSLAEGAVAAAEDLGFLPIVVVGGVARNRRLRELLGEVAAERGMPVTFPAPELCTDNGAMIAAAGVHKPPSKHLDPPTANLPLESWAPRREA